MKGRLAWLVTPYYDNDDGMWPPKPEIVLEEPRVFNVYDKVVPIVYFELEQEDKP